MPKQNNSVKEMLQELEKLTKKVINKSLKDRTLDYTVQFSISNLDPNTVKYAAQISSPAAGVQPIYFVHDSFNDLKASLEQAAQELDRKAVELVFHQSRINTYKNKIQAHEERMVQIENGDEEDEEDIELERV